MRSTLITLAALLLAACTHSPVSTIGDSLPDNVVISDRLSNQKVKSFAEDRDGHIWIGTFRGLNKFTSTEYFQFFCTDDSLGLPDNQINAVYCSKKGRLWVATANGLAVRKDDGNFHRIPSPSRGNNINHIMETRDGQLLFSNSESIFKYDPQEDALKTVIRELNSFGERECVDENRLWAISGGGFVLNCYDIRDFSLLQSIPLPHQVYHLCDAGAGELWMSGMGSISILDKNSLAWKELPQAIKARKEIVGGDVDLIFNVDGYSMLLNVINKGMFFYHRTTGTVLSEGEAGFPFDVPDADIQTVFRDSRGNLWIGTVDQGYKVSYQYKNQFNTNKFLTESFRGKSVTSLFADKGDKLWITTTRDGLWLYDRPAGILKRIDVSYLIQDNSIGYVRCSRVFRDADGDYWLLFMDKFRAVRCRWDGSRFAALDYVWSQNPMSIVQDDRKNIWVGGFTPEITVFDKSTRKSHNVSVLPNGGWTFVSDMVMDEPGKLILTAFNQDLLMLNTYSEEVTALQLSPEEEARCIKRSVRIPNRIFKDTAGDFWMATVANGLLRREAKTKVTAPVEGISCLDVCSIEEDHQGNIWASTMNGLCKYDRTVNSVTNYFDTDGIGGNQFIDRSSCVMEDGTLVFGGTHGITLFQPMDVVGKRSVPLVFERLAVHNIPVIPSPDGPISKVLSEKPDVTIKHSQNAFSISFAALDYSELKRTRYYYMMEGFDKEWVDAGHTGEAYYANLPDGKYTFRVRIDDSSHSLVETEESLKVRVLPPWYRTWWAYILFFLAACLIAGVLWTFYQRIRKVRSLAARRIFEVRQQRAKAEEAEKAEKELNRIQMNYFSNVAHEFRTPLTMIAGPAQQLSVSDGIKGQDRELVSIIKRNSTWMLSLVNQLLDFNRIGNKKLQMKVSKMDIVEPLRDIAGLFRYNADSKGIELVTRGLEDPFTMWVDADKVQKVVMNLLSNALKFTPPGGRVALEFDVIPREEAAARFPLKEEDKDGQWACISIADSGIGIPEGELEKIFERFYQTSGSKESLGSGIGLYYARALTTLHHGYIKAWNREEGGALLSFVLPVSAASYSEDERTTEKPNLQVFTAAETAPAAQESADESSCKHIVVVDDDIDIANYLKILLKPHYKVSLYFDAMSALKGMEEDAPDLIISDVVMPGMSGTQFCSEVKNSLTLSHIPVVLVTAKVAVEDQVQGLGIGADAYVTKPFQPAYLMALIKSLLENREKLHRQLGSVTTTEEIAPEALSPRDAAFMNELYELMENELANADLDIMRSTQMMKISRTKFYYKVKGLTGENPSVFFKRYKLNRAASLLKEGKLNMSEIAWKTGFNTLSHFSTSFKKQFGVPPSEYIG